VIPAAGAVLFGSGQGGEVEAATARRAMVVIRHGRGDGVRPRPPLGVSVAEKQYAPPPESRVFLLVAFAGIAEIIRCFTL
jgi:hypothetical protein